MTINSDYPWLNSLVQFFYKFSAFVSDWSSAIFIKLDMPVGTFVKSEVDAMIKYWALDDTEGIVENWVVQLLDNATYIFEKFGDNITLAEFIIGMCTFAFGFLLVTKMVALLKNMVK